MLVTCIKTYDDKQLKRRITPKDDFYEVTEERAKELVSAGVAVVVEDDEKGTETTETPELAEIPEAVKKPKKRKKKGE